MLSLAFSVFIFYKFSLFFLQIFFVEFLHFLLILLDCYGINILLLSYILNDIKTKGEKSKMKRKEESAKRNKGITLITLAITIIVLLILAGISINALVSDNGIIKQALKSTNSAKEFENDFNKKQSSLISEISGSNKANLVCNNVGEDFVTVKIEGAGANKYQFSLDGTNWSAEQSENEYTFKNLTKAVVNKDNYKDVTGTEYKVYSKAIDSDGNELVYGPIKVKTSVVVEADSKYLEYEELNGEITITGILYNQDYELNSLEEMENMLASPEKILIPSYIDGKPVTRISEELIKETTTTLKEKDENVHAWALNYGRYL